MQQEELAQEIVQGWADAYRSENRGNIFERAVRKVAYLYEKRDEMLGLLPIA